MALMYTSLPLSSPTRQRYQSIIDNSSALIAKRWGREGTRQSVNSANTDWARTLNNMYSSGIDRYSPYSGSNQKQASQSGKCLSLPRTAGTISR